MQYGFRGGIPGLIYRDGRVMLTVPSYCSSRGPDILASIEVDRRTAMTETIRAGRSEGGFVSKETTLDIGRAGVLPLYGFGLSMNGRPEYDVEACDFMMFDASGRRTYSASGRTIVLRRKEFVPDYGTAVLVRSIKAGPCILDTLDAPPGTRVRRKADVETEEGRKRRKGLLYSTKFTLFLSEGGVSLRVPPANRPIEEDLLVTTRAGVRGPVKVTGNGADIPLQPLDVNPLDAMTITVGKEVVMTRSGRSFLAFNPDGTAGRKHAGRMTVACRDPDDLVIDSPVLSARTVGGLHLLEVDFGDGGTVRSVKEGFRRDSAPEPVLGLSGFEGAVEGVRAVVDKEELPVHTEMPHAIPAGDFVMFSVHDDSGWKSPKKLKTLEGLEPEGAVVTVITEGRGSKEIYRFAYIPEFEVSMSDGRFPPFNPEASIRIGGTALRGCIAMPKMRGPFDHRGKKIRLAYDAPYVTVDYGLGGMMPSDEPVNPWDLEPEISVDMVGTAIKGFSLRGNEDTPLEHLMVSGVPTLRSEEVLNVAGMDGAVVCAITARTDAGDMPVLRIVKGGSFLAEVSDGILNVAVTPSVVRCICVISSVDGGMREIEMHMGDNSIAIRQDEIEAEVESIYEGVCIDSAKITLRNLPLAVMHGKDCRLYLKKGSFMLVPTGMVRNGVPDMNYLDSWFDMLMGTNRDLKGVPKARLKEAFEDLGRRWQGYRLAQHLDPHARNINMFSQT